MPLQRDRSASQKRRSAPIPESALAEMDTENRLNEDNSSLRNKPIPEQKEPLVEKKSDPAPQTRTDKKLADHKSTTMPKVDKKPTDQAPASAKSAAPRTPRSTKRTPTGPTKGAAEKQKPKETVKPRMHKSPDIENLAQPSIQNSMEIENLTDDPVAAILLNLAEQAASETPPGPLSPSGTVILSSANPDAPNIDSDSETKTISEIGKQQTMKIARSITQTMDAPKVLRPVTGGSKSISADNSQSNSLKNKDPAIKKSSQKPFGAQKTNSEQPPREGANEALKLSGVRNTPVGPSRDGTNESLKHHGESTTFRKSSPKPSDARKRRQSSPQGNPQASH